LGRKGCRASPRADQGACSAVVSLGQRVTKRRGVGRSNACDTEDVIRSRLRIYHDEAEPLLAYYHAQLLTVCGVAPVDHVSAQVLIGLSRSCGPVEPGSGISEPR